MKDYNNKNSTHKNYKYIIKTLFYKDVTFKVPIKSATCEFSTIFFIFKKYHKKTYVVY